MPIVRSSALWALILLVASLSCSKNGAGEPNGPEAPEVEKQRPQLERDEPLPELARDLLRKYMVEHGDSMESLLWSALMLEHQMTEVVVEQILAQPRLSRPNEAAGETLNDWLPAAFYELQDQIDRKSVV